MIYSREVLVPTEIGSVLFGSTQCMVKAFEMGSGRYPFVELTMYLQINQHGVRLPSRDTKNQKINSS